MPAAGPPLASDAAIGQTPPERLRQSQAEKERRQRAKLASQIVEGPEVKPKRGHAAEPFFHSRSAIGQAATNRL
jgi:hypothetical protein